MADPFKTHGALSWCELMTDDTDRAGAFYTEVLGWESEVMDMGTGPYTVFKIGGAPVGGMMGKPPGTEGMPNHWGAYITVDDVDACVEKAKGAGGNVLNGPFDVPTVGRIAQIQDPAGAVISLIAYAEES